MSETPRHLFDRWLSRLVRLAALAMLVLIGVLIWQIVQIVGEVRAGLATVAHEAERVSRRVDGMANELASMDQKLEQAEAHFGQAVHQQEIERTVAGALERAGAPAAGTGPQEKIRMLLNRINNPQLRYETDDDEDSAAKFYAKCVTKYQVYGGERLHPGAFIERVSTTTFENDPYYVVFPDGRRKPVKRWLEQLLTHAERSQPTETSSNQ